MDFGMKIWAALLENQAMHTPMGQCVAAAVVAFIAHAMGKTASAETNLKRAEDKHMTMMCTYAGSQKIDSDVLKGNFPEDFVHPGSYKAVNVFPAQFNVSMKVYKPAKTAITDFNGLDKLFPDISCELGRILWKLWSDQSHTHFAVKFFAKADEFFVILFKILEDTYKDMWHSLSAFRHEQGFLWVFLCSAFHAVMDAAQDNFYQSIVDMLKLAQTVSTPPSYLSVSKSYQDAVDRMGTFKFDRDAFGVFLLRQKYPHLFIHVGNDLTLAEAHGIISESVQAVSGQLQAHAVLTTPPASGPPATSTQGGASQKNPKGTMLVNNVLSCSYCKKPARNGHCYKTCFTRLKEQPLKVQQGQHLQGSAPPGTQGYYSQQPAQRGMPHQGQPARFP
jgi:hypothetical protein